MTGIKQLLLILAVVGCGELAEEKAAKAKAAAEANTLEAAIRRELNKPTGELTKADYEKVTRLELFYNSITDSRYKITDAGLKDIAKMKQFTTLTLSYNRNITDAGLKEVAKFKQLRILQVQNTKATKAGVAALQKALPDCNIISNPLTQPAIFLGPVNHR